MSLVLALLLLAGGEPAEAPQATPAEQLRNARGNFDYANYAKAALLAEELLRSGALIRPQDQIEADRILGLSRYYTRQSEEARKAFLDLLLLDPDYQLDAFYVPPDAITFFEEVRTANQEQLEPIRVRRRADAQRLAEEARRPPPTPVVHEQVEAPKHLIVALLPGGAGQFQNGNPQLGYVLAISESVLVAAALVCQIPIETQRNSSGTWDPSAYQSAKTFQAVQITAASIAGLLWVLGAAEAVWHFKPATTTRIEPPPPSASGTGISSRLGIALDASPTGAAARMTLSF